ncbi:MAG TPA: serine/threonine-protein kinase [Drouetiella sp.]
MRRIRYETVPRLLLLAACGVYLVSFASVVAAIFWISWWLPLVFYVHLAALTVVLSVGVVCVRKTYVEFDSAELHFPFSMAGDLLFRLDRAWEDVAAIGIEDGDNDYEFQTYSDELRQKVLFIYFKSGGHANLHLANLDSGLLKNFIDNLISNTKRGTCTPELIEMQRQLAFSKVYPELESSDAAPLAFTQMWENELEQHMSTTNFVPLESGSELQNGKFVVRKGISFGGMSAVYLGTMNDGKEIVIKESSLPIRCDPASKAKARELFEREALLLYKIQHPKIAKVIDYFVEEGKDYLILEYAYGCSLRQYVREKGPLDSVVATKYFLQMCSIVDYLHNQKPQVLHRDLTPDNFILGPDNQIVLIDFGAANEYVGTATGTVIGKQNYIAPEQLQGRATVGSDIYSLGCTVHFLLTAVDPEPLTMSHPILFDERIPKALDDIVALATAYDSVKRPRDVATLVAMLRQTDAASPFCDASVSPARAK